MAEILRRLAASALIGGLSTVVFAASSDAAEGVVSAAALVVGAAGAGREFVAATPARVFDSRTGLGAASVSSIAPVKPVSVQIGGRDGIPANADSVAVNVTVTNAKGDGFALVYPAGMAPPKASSVNFRGGESRSNLVLAKLGAGGRLSLVTNVEADVVLDVVGYFVNPALSGPGARLHALAPSRLLDSRMKLGLAGPLIADSTATVVVRGRNGVAADAQAVLVNLTATDASSGTYIAAYGDGDRPATSTINVGPNDTRSNMAIVPLAADGSMRLYNYAGVVDVVADVLGYFGPGSVDAGSAGQVVIGPPSRLFDSREADVVLGDTGPGTLAFNLAVGETGAQVTGAVLNVTHVNPTRDSYVTVWPADLDQPIASNINTAAGNIVSNLVVVPLGPDGTVNFANYRGEAGIVVDLVGVVIA